MKRARQVFLDSHHRTTVIELAAVVGGRKDCHQLLFGEKLVPVLDHLMGPADEVELIFPEEVEDDVLAEDEADSPL